MTLIPVGEGGSAPSFTPHADADRYEGLFCFIALAGRREYSIRISVDSAWHIVYDMFTFSLQKSMGMRKKNRTKWKAERKVQIKKISAKRLKNARKKQAAA